MIRGRREAAALSFSEGFRGGRLGLGKTSQVLLGFFVFLGWAAAAAAVGAAAGITATMISSRESTLTHSPTLFAFLLYSGLRTPAAHSLSNLDSTAAVVLYHREGHITRRRTRSCPRRSECHLDKQAEEANTGRWGDRYMTNHCT